MHAGDILAARIAQMRLAADEALASGSGDDGSGATEHMTAVRQCAAERRALLSGALRALWGPTAAPPSD